MAKRKRSSGADRIDRAARLRATPFTVAIVGRPNVGKSTLFNRLVGRRVAIVDDTPGVTRDRREGHADLAGLLFTVFDTAGLEDASDRTLEGRMRGQTERAVEDADVALLVIDARSGVTPMDRHFAAWLRRKNRPVILIANKCEGRAAEAGLHEAFGLGLGEPVALSAEHGEGLGELFQALLKYAPQGADTAADEEDEDEIEVPEVADEKTEALELDEDEAVLAQTPLLLAVVGRPNVGKSSLVNRLLGEDRMLTGPEAGITRDAIASEWEYGGRRIRLVDTAGLRRKSHVVEKLEKLSTADTLDTIRRAQVVALVIDSHAILEKQDLAIGRLVVEEGRALVIVINKWDLVENAGETLKTIDERLEMGLAQAKGVPAVCVSARTGRGMDKLMQAVAAVEKTWRRRVPTAALNRWLAEAQDRHPPPAVKGGKRVRLRFATQVGTRPPTFALFASRPEELSDSYLRYLENSLREVFDIPGVPVRLMLRKGKNPFAGKER